MSFQPIQSLLDSVQVVSQEQDEDNEEERVDEDAEEAEDQYQEREGGSSEHAAVAHGGASLLSFIGIPMAYRGFHLPARASTSSCDLAKSSFFAASRSTNLSSDQASEAGTSSLSPVKTKWKSQRFLGP